METLNFKDFATRMNAFLTLHFTGEVYTTTVTGQEVWDAYLAAFPEGTNDIFRERPYHDGSYDRNAIRAIGNIVTFDGDELVSIWDCANLEYPYNVVAETLSKLVKSGEIDSVFRTDQKRIGNKPNVDNHNSEILWDHFLFDIPENLYVNTRRESVETVVGRRNENRAMLLRAVTELKETALDDIIALIEDNNLYRGAEHLRSVKLMKEHINLTPIETWKHAGNDALSRFRNSVIGTLAVDLSEGMEVDAAVKRFEDKVAPHNYKRPKALITQTQINSAMETIEELGLEASLERRLATVEDLSVNDVLWVNNDTQAHMKGGVRSLLEASVSPKPVKTSKVTEISIDDFMKNIAPKAQTIEALVTNNHIGNLMTVTAANNQDSPALFNWDSGFAWSYNGDVADGGIRGRVIKAGGSTDGVLRVSLAWDNADDLDLHCHADTNTHYFWGNRGGILDVDMNAGGETNTVDPVENMIFTKLDKSTYEFSVENYTRRDDTSKGFTIQVETAEGIQEYSLDYQLRHKERIKVLEVKAENGKIVSIKPTKEMKGGQISTELWGIKTESFAPVSMILNSPNHWEDSNKTGNKHTFFILEGCKNPNSVRGIYNEFLKGELTKHRRVFEVLGAKTRCESGDTQLSGVGLSSTKKDDIILRADGRNYKILFGE